MKKIDHYFKKKTPPEPEQCSSTSSSLISTKSFSESATDSRTSSTVSSYDPPYPDIGKMKENDLSNHEFKINILQKTWE